MFDFPSQVANLRGNRGVGALQPLLHDPESGVVGGAQLYGFVGDALAHARVGMIVVPLPALKDGLANSEQAGTVALQVEAKGPIEEALRFVARDGSMLKVELELPVNVGEVYAVEHPAFFLHLGKQRRSWHRRVQHELMEVGAMRNRVFDFLLDILRRVVFEADDGGTQQLDAVLPQLSGEGLRIPHPSKRKTGARWGPRIGIMQLHVA